MFFFEVLLEKGIPNEQIIGLIIRYHFMVFCLIFFSVYLSIQPQPLLLGVLLYLKLYFNIMDPRSTKASLTDLYQQAKKDTKKGLTNTRNTIAEFKEKYQTKTVQKEENKSDEQP